MDESAAEYISDFLFEFLPGLWPKPMKSAFRWDDPSVRHAQLRTKLDAYYAPLYGLTRDELRYAARLSVWVQRSPWGRCAIRAG